jgi:hypothetical protein
MNEQISIAHRPMPKYSIDRQASRSQDPSLRFGSCRQVSLLFLLLAFATGEHTMTLSDILGALAIFAIPLAMLAL